ncbi:semaphorin-5A-like, partial [Stegodyphus dumicola]|uniref:semaphorin-5A-like n=1 Tax=Stegodyphus dumicola TaxID=202533 RepID=UPI0015AB5458
MLLRNFVCHRELQDTMETFSESTVVFTELLFDTERYQFIVGARDCIYRLSLEGLRVLEKAAWPAPERDINTCIQKGQSEEDCHNYIRVLLMHNNRLFICGTNAFSPECSWRDVNSLHTVHEWKSGLAKCPSNPHTNSTALMTSEGDYYLASALDFSSQNYAIVRIMGTEPFLRTVQYDPKWLN